MASTTIFGNFTIIDASVINSQSNGHLTYALYNTSFYTADLQSAFSAILCCFLSSGATPYPDNTTIFVYGKICAPSSQIFLIEAINMFVYPGDVSDANYGIVPAFAPHICILGHVQGGVETTYEDQTANAKQRPVFVPKVHMPSMNSLNNANSQNNNGNKPNGTEEDCKGLYIIPGIKSP
ncbi:hypothetical protein M422DRAFT_257281 [Sphaerobolus stellatus SS14]|uniref:Uncharacterized protein n=1 Tax=Sphaerobolus stellatus (strain SS14) TaxID=990650 RepID=A0A0C9UA30_SPHS4|nr:hypothetical protein M422DRAFT_257281 [Sphaerobolus stellatus SS14]